MSTHALVSRLLQHALRLYGAVSRSLWPTRCRYTPSCSAYAIEALQRHGAGRGLKLAARRLMRCHPGQPGGFDPVP